MSPDTQLVFPHAWEIGANISTKPLARVGVATSSSRFPVRNWAAPHLALQPPRTLCIPLPPPMLTGLHTILAVSCARAGLRAMSDASGPVRECRRARFEDTLRSTSQAEEDTAEKWRGRTHAPCCDSCSDVRGASPPHRRTPRQLDVFVYLSLMNRIFLLIHQCMNGICFLIIRRRI